MLKYSLSLKSLTAICCKVFTYSFAGLTGNYSSSVTVEILSKNHNEMCISYFKKYIIEPTL